ncbi:unnamed protein product [Hyaloperonospora brassicae]|uniref:FHA domain-containing protein n=1 Tax=Hyaloperonospora brassicae TaxID=162125 RepID=A0AAV0UV32_HYABA|nr:unnamed protein product [Hyaloperonospora brassicae]
MAAPRVCFHLEATCGPREGSAYRFCALSRSAPSTAPSAPALAIGRKKRCWLRLVEDLEVSSAHADIRCADGADSGTRVALCDTKSTNGTRVNDALLQPQRNYLLDDGDVIAVGRTRLRFVQVGHTRLCEYGAADGTAADSTAATSSGLLSPSVAPSTRSPVVCGPEEDNVEATCALSSSVVPSAVVGSLGTTTAIEESVEQPETEPAQGEVIGIVPSTSVVAGSRWDVGSLKESIVRSCAESAVERGGEDQSGAVEALGFEEATCTTCGATIGQLSMLEQQAHHNACLGGRVATAPSKRSTTATKPKTKTRKRANTASNAAREAKSPKSKASHDSEHSAAGASKTKKPRKRKRANIEDDITVALAAVGASIMGKEQEVDLKLAATKKKLAQLDDQMQKLVKRRMNLVKMMDRLERTKENLRKSQVLPPSRVMQILDLKSALAVIFPSDRRARTTNRRADKVQARTSSNVAKQYTSSKWKQHDGTSNCSEYLRAEQAAVDAIPMWARASQQLFGLQHDSLLYQSSVLQSDHDDAASRSVYIEAADIVDCVGSEDAVIVVDDECENNDAKSESVAMPSDNILNPTQDDSEVPNAVKRVFADWHRDVAFLRDQSADDIELALKTLNETRAGTDVTSPSCNVLSDEPGCFEERSDDNKRRISGPDLTIAQETDQQTAYDYMTKVMMQLIIEKRQSVVGPAKDVKEQSERTSVVECMEESQEELE